MLEWWKEDKAAKYFFALKSLLSSFSFYEKLMNIPFALEFLNKLNNKRIIAFIKWNWA